MKPHITIENINAYVQYQNGDKDYFRLSVDTLEKITSHLAECQDCQRNYQFSKQTYTLLSKKKPNLITYLSSAAAIIVFGLTFILSNKGDLREENYLSVADFNLTMNRGGEMANETVLDENKLIYWLHENQFDSVLSICELNKQTYNYNPYIAALVLKGQKENNKDLLEKALIQSSNDSLKSKIKLIIKKEK